MTDLQTARQVFEIWRPYMPTPNNWESLVKGIEPKSGGCGLVYELQNPVDRPSESFAIADMRQLDISEPHKHANGEIEIYYVIQGRGQIAVGKEVSPLSAGEVIITPSDTVHITLPEDDLVLAVINLPPFNINNYQPIPISDPAVAGTIARLRAAVSAGGQAAQQK